MTLSRLVAAAALAGLLALPAASAGLAAPKFYFLVDGPDGHVADGVLEAFDQANPNVPNATVPQTRQVFPAGSDTLPVQFTTAGVPHPDRIKGPVYVALWLAPSAFSNANLTVTLYEKPQAGAVSSLPVPVPLPDPFLPPPAGSGVPRALASASLALDANASRMPGPTQLVPPPPAVPPPTDPDELQAYVLAIAGHEVAQLYPVLLQPPQLFYLGNLDVAVNATSDLALGFTITKGSSPAPLPLGAFGQVQYDAAIAPSYALVPWYDSTAQAPPPSVQPPVTRTASPAPTAGPGATGSGTTVGYTEGDKGTPDTGLLVLPVLAALALALRRRQA